MSFHPVGETFGEAFFVSIISQQEVPLDPNVIISFG